MSGTTRKRKQPDLKQKTLAEMTGIGTVTVLSKWWEKYICAEVLLTDAIAAKGDDDGVVNIG